MDVATNKLILVAAQAAIAFNSTHSTSITQGAEATTTGSTTAGSITTTTTVA